MITLDGKEYTFNGYGEYHILLVAGPDFKLQGRMQPLINDDGSSARATIYKAFAMKENGSDAVQVTYLNIGPKLTSQERGFILAETSAVVTCCLDWKKANECACYNPELS